MKFILASGNEHKAREFEDLFLASPLEIVPAPRGLEVEEIGETFFDNALIKAKAYFQEFKSPVLADDSGLVVASFPDILGVKSARFGGDGLSDRDRAELLLKTFRDAKADLSRSAYFVCLLCFYLSPEEVFFFEGRLSGQISLQYTGTGGFGYDPIFIPDSQEGRTLAELAEWKKKHSHRAVAGLKALNFFTQRSVSPTYQVLSARN